MTKQSPLTVFQVTATRTDGRFTLTTHRELTAATSHATQLRADGWSADVASILFR